MVTCLICGNSSLERPFQPHPCVKREKSLKLTLDGNQAVLRSEGRVVLVLAAETPIVPKVTDSSVVQEVR